MKESDYLLAHKCIHAGHDRVYLQGKLYPIMVFTNSRCRYVKVGEETIVEQNKHKTSKYAKLRVLTWIIPRIGSWKACYETEFYNSKAELDQALLEQAVTSHG